MTSKLVKTERKPISKIYQTASSTKAILRSWKERQAHPHCCLLRGAPSLQRTRERQSSGNCLLRDTHGAGDRGSHKASRWQSQSGWFPVGGHLQAYLRTWCTLSRRTPNKYSVLCVSLWALLQLHPTNSDRFRFHFVRCLFKNFPWDFLLTHGSDRNAVVSKPLEIILSSYYYWLLVWIYYGQKTYSVWLQLF